MTPRRGPWQQTFTGRRWYPLDPHPEDVCIEDVAHHLSNACRFTGAVRTFYSVAQHSFLVSYLVPDRLAFAALMHDAHEAYAHDVSSPMKDALRTMSAAYDILEGKAAFAVARRFGISKPSDADAAVLHHADLVARATERRDLMHATDDVWGDSVEPDEDVISAWTPAAAERQFLDRFYHLTSAALR